MAYDREQLMTALRNADAAGDTEGATRIAQMIQLQGQQAQETQQPSSPMVSAEENARQENVVNNANVARCNW
ncbi:MAG: hypothetical protein ACMZI0_15180 [Symbiopectobacterium sp.]|uniref:hypothetical protein n=1 Tax=Symbiopectobacterium sp. TaxID=2952789 RepID=UPI0039EA00AF